MLSQPMINKNNCLKQSQSNAFFVDLDDMFLFLRVWNFYFQLLSYLSLNVFVWKKKYTNQLLLDCLRNWQKVVVESIVETNDVVQIFVSCSKKNQKKIKKNRIVYFSLYILIVCYFRYYICFSDWPVTSKRSCKFDSIILFALVVFLFFFFFWK